MFQCKKCPVCNAKPFIREGKPLQNEDGIFFIHVYQCREEGNANCGQDICEVRTDIFDNSKQIEVYY